MFRNRYYVVVECLMLMSICPDDDDDAARYSLAMQKRPTDVLHTRLLTKLSKDRQQQHQEINIMRYDDHDATAVGMQWHIIYANNFDERLCELYVVCMEMKH